MKEVCYYLADDGTRFETEKECLEYEFKQEIGNVVGEDKELILFDNNHKKITNCTFNSIYDAVAIRVRTMKGASLVIEWSDDYGVDAPFSEWDIEHKGEELLGTWVYDALDHGGWTHLDKLKRRVDELYIALQ